MGERWARGTISESERRGRGEHSLCTVKSIACSLMMHTASENASTPVQSFERGGEGAQSQSRLVAHSRSKQRDANAPLRTKNLGHVPPRLETVLRSYLCSEAGVGQLDDSKISAAERATHSHISPANQWIRDLGMKRRDTDELDRTALPTRAHTRSAPLSLPLLGARSRGQARELTSKSYCPQYRTPRGGSSKSASLLPLLFGESWR